MDGWSVMENPTAIFYPKLSFYLLSYLLFVHLFAAGCLIALMNGVMICLFAFALLISVVLYSCYYSGLLTADRVDCLQCVALNKWMLFLANGTTREAVLMRNSVVMRYFMLLYFFDQNTKKKHVVLLFPDSLPREQLKIIRRCARVGVM